METVSMESVSMYYEKADPHLCFADTNNLDKKPNAEMLVESEAPKLCH